ncbi:MAG: ATP-binding cassette domain-containing protein [Prevotellaceae bacterium]|jgi:ABC-2 type transport system ATP-binding protein|nr:ATP-binding cassette domain-containing protein [Prevotellaceae bacterium]
MILRTENIVKQYANHLALDNVSIEVPQASIYGLLGPNGAGKTTLIRIINQITAPDSGKVYFDGHKLQETDVYSIGYLPEERGLYKKMKVGEQAMYFARLKGLTKHDAEKSLRKWFEKFEIQAWWNKKVEELSKGMAQKVQFIVTILHNPKLLIFDEPFSGFDPINVNLLKTEILNLKKQGSTIIFSTHNMASVEEICDYITLINKSKNVLSGQIDEIRHNYGDNVFEIDYRGETDKLMENIGNNYQVLDSGEQKFFRKIKVKAITKETGNALISRIIKDAEIINFNEIIPSMNDIFIKIVEDDK